MPTSDLWDTRRAECSGNNGVRVATEDNYRGSRDSCDCGFTLRVTQCLPPGSRTGWCARKSLTHTCTGIPIERGTEGSPVWRDSAGLLPVAISAVPSSKRIGTLRFVRAHFESGNDGRYDKTVSESMSKIRHGSRNAAEILCPRFPKCSSCRLHLIVPLDTPASPTNYFF